MDEVVAVKGERTFENTVGKKNTHRERREKGVGDW
jgi:hypothetical protein